MTLKRWRLEETEAIQTQPTMQKEFDSTGVQDETRNIGGERREREHPVRGVSIPLEREAATHVVDGGAHGVVGRRL